MTSVAAAPPVTEAEVIAYGLEVLARVREHGYQHLHRNIHSAYYGLQDALQTYGLISSRQRHPVSEYPDLGAGWPDDALDRGLRRAADEVRDWASALVITIREQCGPDVAAHLAAKGGDRT